MNSRLMNKAGAMRPTLIGAVAAAVIALPQIGHAQQAILLADAGAASAPLNLEMNTELPAAVKPPPQPSPPPAAAEQGAAAKPAAAGEQKAPAAPAADGKVRVIYLPESERQRIRDELRAEILETARKENWAQPGGLPEWVKRIHPAGDLMVRVERDFYTNTNSSQFFDFRAINNGPPINVTPPTAGQPLTIPFLNSTQDRTLPRFRLRYGFTADVAPGVTANIRLSSGNATNPVSPTTTLGGDFNKYSFLLDRAYIRYQLSPGVSAELGRLPNPFVTYSEMVWDNDLSFDGLGASFSQELGDDWTMGASGGAFSVENTDPNLPSSSIVKIASRDKWLFGGQVLATWRATDKLTFQPTAAYYYYSHAQGALSSSCYAPNTAVACDSDGSRPLFVQKGNTMFAIRNLVLVNPGDPQYQYFGLASAFRIGHITFSGDMAVTDVFHVAVDTEYARNFAFNRKSVEDKQPVNNLGACQITSTSDCSQSFVGGGNAYQMQVRLGNPQVARRWDWQGALGCRYVESDSLLDAFDDSDFHLGGTNTKGCFINATLGIATSSYAKLRYLSAREVSGPPLVIDVIQVDFGVNF